MLYHISSNRWAPHLMEVPFRWRHQWRAWRIPIARLTLANDDQS
jgi:hypothetical protein